MVAVRGGVTWCWVELRWWSGGEEVLGRVEVVVRG
jgi:hypothetical protein